MVALMRVKSSRTWGRIQTASAAATAATMIARTVRRPSTSPCDVASAGAEEAGASLATGPVLKEHP